MTKETDTMSGARSFHDKTDRYYVCGLTISCQNQLILCLGLHHFTTKHTDAMSGAWPFHDKQTDTMSGDWSFHDKTHWYHVWSLTISWQNTLIPCLELDHFMTKHTDTMSGAWPFHDKTHWYYVWGSTISWQKRLYNDLIVNIYMYNWIGNRFYNLLVPLHDWYYVWGYVWGLTISWQNRQILCLGLDHFMTKQIVAISGAW
jgi:hypothetical protein